MQRLAFILTAVAALAVSCGSDDDCAFGEGNTTSGSQPELEMGSSAESGDGKPSASPDSTSGAVPTDDGEMEFLAVKGYTSTSSSGLRQCLIGSGLAALTGLSNQVYNAEIVTVSYALNVPGISSYETFFSPAPSPACGLLPGYGSGELEDFGYVPEIKGNVVEMKSCTIHIVSDLSGRSYNVWYPREPSEFEWIYVISTMF